MIKPKAKVKKSEERGCTKTGKDGKRFLRLLVFRDYFLRRPEFRSSIMTCVGRKKTTYFSPEQNSLSPTKVLSPPILSLFQVMHICRMCTFSVCCWLAHAYIRRGKKEDTHGFASLVIQVQVKCKRDEEKRGKRIEVNPCYI